MRRYPHEQQEEAAPEHRLRDVQLRLQEVVRKRQDRDGIDCAVEPMPVGAEPPDSSVRRGRAKRHEPQKRREADEKVDAKHDLGRNAREVEGEIEGVEREVQEGVGEDREPEHAPHQD
jgi:hypothetical protein